MYSFPLHGVVQLRFLVNFDGKLALRDLMIAGIDGSVSTLTDRLADLVVVKNSVSVMGA